MRIRSSAVLLFGALLLLPLHAAGQKVVPAPPAGMEAMAVQPLDAVSAPGAVFVSGTIPALEAVPGIDAGSASQDFLFHQPDFTLTLRGGMFLSRADSEVFDDVVRLHTIERSDFNTGSGGIEAGLALGERLELVVGLDGGQATLDSEMRDWVENGQPIVQTTRLRNGPTFTGGLKAYLFPRGESISQFAWTPRRANLFVGAGLGGTGYEFEQWGDFVDELNELVVTGDFVSSGGAFAAYASGGLDIALNNRVSLVGEARYLWSKTKLGLDFDLRELDLSGLRLTAGLGFRL